MMIRACRSAVERRGEHALQPPGIPLFAIEVRIVDADLHAGGSPGCEERAEKRLELFEPQAAGLGGVHRGHDRGIEHVGIHVNPEARRSGGREALGLASYDLGRSGRAKALDAPPRDRRRRRLVTKPNRDDVLGADERPEAFEIREAAGSDPRRERQIHPGGRARRRGLRRGEIGVPVQEEEARAPAPPEREERSEKDRAVAAENERKLAAFECAADAVGQRDQVTRERGEFRIPVSESTSGA